ncbi:substrate-binding domain-containing protein [Burkholderia anthina]|uniref:substrate-binding domain-containing protein n=1 Tax=Burkholderia anthina TaxID=179879 RepID=UPI003C7C515E
MRDRASFTASARHRPFARRAAFWLAAAAPASATHPDDAKKLLDYLASPQAQPVVRATGLDSVAASPAP